MRRNPFTRISTVCGCVLALALAAAPAPARADVDDLTIMQMSEILEQGRQANDHSRPIQTGPSFNEKIQEARDAYWKAYLQGPVPQDVEERFSKLLGDKDLVLMINLFAYEAGQQGVKDLGVQRPDGEPDLGDLLFQLYNADADHGVRPTAAGQFIKWHDKIKERRDRIQPKVNVFTWLPATTAAMMESIVQRDPELQAYVKARNDAEKLAVLDRLPFPNTREYLLTYISLSGGDRAEFEKQLKTREDVAGPERVAAAVETLRKAPKDRDGLFARAALEDADGDQLRLPPIERIERIIAQTDPKLYAIWLIRLDQRVDWQKAQEIYQNDWVKAFGEQTVLHAAKKVLAAPKNVQLSREGLQQEIAGQRRPAAALVALMPHSPYRDRPLGSLESQDPYEFLFAVLKEYAGVKHWNETRDRYQDLVVEWGEPELMETVKRLIAAPRNAQGQLTSPRDLGVSSANPWEALRELLGQRLATPENFFLHQARAAARGSDALLRTISPPTAQRRYAQLVDAFGKDNVERAIDRVRQAVEKKADLAKLEGNTSGVSEPVAAVYEILWSNATPEQYLQYLLEDERATKQYFDRYGRDTMLTIADKLRTAPKQPESVERALSSPGAVSIADPKNVGLEPNSRGVSALGVRSALDQLLLQEQKRLAAQPFEVGQQLEHKSHMRGFAVVLRQLETSKGMHYLINENGRCTWQPHDTMRQWYTPVSGVNDKIRPAPEPRPLTNAVWGKGQPVLAWVNGKYCKGTVLFYEGRSQPPSWAIEYTPADKPGGTEVDLFAGNQLRELPISADEYPVGSKVRLKMRRQTLEGVVRNVDEQRGLTVEVQSGGRRPRPMQVRISSRRMIEQYELELVDAAHETK